MTIVVNYYMMTLGLCQAGATLAGQQIGKGNIEQARKYYYVAKLYACVIITIAIFSQILFANQLIGVFTQLTEIKKRALQLFIYVSLNTFCDFWKGMEKGLILALAQQQPTVYINIVIQWGVFLGLQLFLGFYLKWGLDGIWIAKVIAEACFAVAYSILVAKTDWEKKAIESAQRQEKDGLQSASTARESGSSDDDVVK